ncbi:hypothetical protein [Pseudomonas fluorescens]|uniref:hypothetical protein n=1 Tax=Pseudomonas fluorescens TaxID=294 RepID=UPI0012421E35|nr:hypothetical protein [Pseudomonas fluorescens]VVM47579.1 hypothetical protein PS639_00608 [Pseudomonas fluorescens]
MKYNFIIALAVLAGCSNWEDSSFNTGDVEYTTLKKNPPVNEVRVFQFADEKGACPLQSTLETPEALVLTAIGYGVKELIAYGKSELERRAQYLDSNIKLNGRSVLTTAWPTQETDDKSGLCLLLVAGEFSANSTGDEVLKKFGQAVKPNMAFEGRTGLKGILNQYELPVPGLTAIVGPFTGLVKDPSFLAEVRITTKMSSDGKRAYVVTPTYLVYPAPLHKMTGNGPRRKVSMDFVLGDATASVSLDDFQSGGIYDSASLKTRYSITESVNGTPFGAVGMVVTEGPDKLPTAKLLRELAAQDEALNKLVDSKIKAMTAEKNAGITEQ